MKSIVFVIVFFVSVAGVAQQQQFTIRGKVGKLSAPAIVYLRYTNGGVSTLDSSLLDAGRFKFKGTVSDPAKALISVNHTGTGRAADMLTVFLEKGTIRVISSDSIKNAKIKGSRLNEDLQKLNLLLGPAGEKMKLLNAEYMALTPEQRKDKQVMEDIDRKSEEITSMRRKVQKEFIEKNPASLISLDALNSYGGYAPVYSEVAPLFESLSAKVRDSKAGRDYSEKLEKTKLTSVGAAAPDFTQNDPNGKPVTLSSFRGKYVLVDFWASWCGPCRAENPNVVRAYQAYRDKNFTVLGVSLDQPDAREKWLKAITDDHLDWNHVSDLKFWKNEVAVQYGINAIPQNFLVSPEGIIVAKNIRGEELQKTLDSIINHKNKTL